MPENANEKMVRVNQAGEAGATRIYAGQLAVMGDRSPAGQLIAAMARQEEAHLETFNALMSARRVRPTLLQPLWSRAGYLLGVASALAGPEAAMACTVAIEEEIDRHYSRQLESLAEAGADPELAGLVREFREDERAHRDTAIEAGAGRAPCQALVSGAIRLACRLAIRVSERI